MPANSVANQPVVFVVDDESMIADTLAEILQRSGYEATAFYCAEDALDASLHTPPQLLLSDVLLLGMNGIDLAVRMRRIFPECKVILFSGQAGTVDLLSSANRQGHQFELLSKPLHPLELLARVAEELKPIAARAD